MVRRLVERHYLDPELEPTPERFRFWLRELRTPALLAECVVRAQAAPSEIAAPGPPRTPHAPGSMGDSAPRRARRWWRGSGA